MCGTYNSELWELLGLELNMPANGKVAYFSESSHPYQPFPSFKNISQAKTTPVVWDKSASRKLTKIHLH